LVAELLDNLGNLNLPLPARPLLDLRAFLESLRLQVLRAFGATNKSSEQYDTLARYEHAVQGVMLDKSENGAVVIECKFDPIELITRLSGESLSQIDLGPRKRTLLVTWDSENETVQHMEIPDSFGDFF